MSIIHSKVFQFDQIPRSCCQTFTAHLHRKMVEHTIWGVGNANEWLDVGKLKSDVKFCHAFIRYKDTH